MAQIKVITTFSGLTKYHEAAVAKSVISLKTMYRDLINITIVSEQREYLQSAHGFANGLYPITVADKKFIERLDFKNAVGFLYGDNHPDIEWMKGLGIKVYCIPTDFQQSLNFNSNIFGSSFTYPKLSYMKDIMFENGLIPVCSGVIV